MTTSFDSTSAKPNRPADKHWRHYSTDSSASASTQCTLNAIPLRDQDLTEWCDYSSDEDFDRPTKLRSGTPTSGTMPSMDEYKCGVSPLRDAVADAITSPRSETAATKWEDEEDDFFDTNQSIEQPHHLEESPCDDAFTPTASSDSDTGYQGICGVLWVERDAFKSSSDCHPLFVPLTELCNRLGVALKRFRTVPNILRWLTKKCTGSGTKRSYVCICQQESYKALEAFFEAKKGRNMVEYF